MQKITPCLWFDDNIEEAVKFYTSIFKNSRITKVSHYGDAGPKPKGTVLTVVFELEGQEFMALNGGPQFKFTEAISLLVNCTTQGELDAIWDKLSAGGQEVQCGWLKDRYGLSWQIVPTIMADMMQDKDPLKVKRVMEAMLEMVKLDIKTLQRAYEGR
jgi:predicted 3-demethylubiquinone-9 3-methyltransferase (glyoxalase superfamily)